ncbi:recombinase family protein [Anaerobacillus isosaccharinicus]|uniref:Recombinase family protein n=1 Tax=Anaerobacillus isosaccharinicus TaxID=1532552 RepID=A0A1S2MAX6_9BACI|nr:recombinase family protein [Anaerobacillus isosaccharinicus]MBA5584531.1 recombinase family protein [Anaerobacillus isosaccharinicus]QOY37086.1 recombinase family protein [Anaerobacillus isosaccharinicus]
MKAALYIRVSTQEQVENYSIETQKERLEAFCKSKGWDVYDVYIDGGFSGSTIDRPALQSMLNDLKNIDAVAVYKLDRLSRSQRDTLTLIEEYFLKNNVDFVSITETLDTSTPFGKAMIGILSVFAQLERETIAERMRMGHIKRAEEGFRGMGGNHDPAGYSRVDGELVIKEDEAEHIRMTYDLYEQTQSITKVQARLKDLGFSVWRFRRYRDILANKLYIGEVSFAGEYYQGRHTPIIDKEQFERVQILLSRHKGPNSYKAKESLLTGLITCSICGESYVTYQTKDKLKNGKSTVYRYYMCRARRFPSEYDSKCTNKTWNYAKLEQVIISEFNSFLLEMDVENKEVDKINYDLQIKKIDEKIERTLNLYVDGQFDKELLNKQMGKLNMEKQSLQAQKLHQDERSNLKISKDQLEQYAVALLASDFSTKHSIIHKLIKHIYVDGDNIEIEWNF